MGQVAHKQAPRPPPPPPPSATKASQRIEEALMKIRPFVVAALAFADFAGPYVVKACEYANKLYHSGDAYGLEEFVQIGLGLMLLFFGGNFPVLIAAIEAFRMSGWDSMKSSLRLLYRQYKLAYEASKKDDAIDENKDGVPDVQQIQHTRELVTRKVSVFLKVTDPRAVNDGMMGVSAGVMSVLATLRVKFAKTVTLGVSLGDCFNETAQKIAGPALQHALPPEHHKWIELGISYVCRSLAVTVAWWCQRIISALHCAMRGGQMILKGVSRALERRNIQLPIDLSPSNPSFPAACTALGGVGFFTQAMHGFQLPFPLNILLLPLRILEWALFYALSYAPE